jgi:ATP-dependent DNA ligase
MVQTDDVKVAEGWLEHAADLGLEGVVAKKKTEPYRPGKRSWVKVKAFETADLVVGGFTGGPPKPLSLLLGAYDSQGALLYVGRTTGIPAADAALLLRSLGNLAYDADTFAGWLRPGLSRWDSHRFDEWFPVRPTLVCEVSFSRLDGHFLRHAARFVRWRPDKDPMSCSLVLLESDHQRVD